MIDRLKLILDKTRIPYGLANKTYKINHNLPNDKTFFTAEQFEDRYHIKSWTKSKRASFGNPDGVYVENDYEKLVTYLVYLNILPIENEIVGGTYIWNILEEEEMLEKIKKKLKNMGVDYSIVKTGLLIKDKQLIIKLDDKKVSLVEALGDGVENITTISIQKEAIVMDRISNKLSSSSLAIKNLVGYVVTSGDDGPMFLKENK